MINIRLSFALACGVLFAAACSAAASSTHESATPTMERAATQHVVAGPVGLDVPASWHVRPGLPNPSGNVAFVYLSPYEVPSECQDTSQGGVCHAWPLVQLPLGGIVVAVRLHGMPGSRPPADGEPMRSGVVQPAAFVVGRQGMPGHRRDGVDRGRRAGDRRLGGLDQPRWMSRGTGRDGR